MAGPRRQPSRPAGNGQRFRKKRCFFLIGGAKDQWKNSGPALVRAPLAHTIQVAALIRPICNAVQAVGKRRVMMALRAVIKFVGDDGAILSCVP